MFASRQQGVAEGLRKLGFILLATAALQEPHICDPLASGSPGASGAMTSIDPHAVGADSISARSSGRLRVSRGPGMPGFYRFSSGTNCKISPGWQSKALHSASSVENRTALALLFFKIDKFAGVMPISSASSALAGGGRVQGSSTRPDSPLPAC